MSDDDHDVPSRPAVGQAGQQQPAQKLRRDARRVGRRRPQGGAGMRVHQNGQCHPGQLIPADRQNLRRPQRPELGHSEDVAVTVTSPRGGWPIARAVSRIAFPARAFVLLRANTQPEGRW